MATDEETPSMPSSSDWPSISQFYSKRDVFMTGATGFLGKCLLEKLIRSIPDLGRVMILIRPKKGKSVQERLEALLGSKVSLSVKAQTAAPPPSTHFPLTHV